MKIKKVIVEGFRAYQTKEDGTFDFSMSTGECANFISLYAPNGFGKTSFYDAVEWALTNNIGRFVRDYTRIENDNLSKSQNQPSKKQYILRNRFIKDTDPSRVTVMCDKGEPRVKKRTESQKWEPRLSFQKRGVGERIRSPLRCFPFSRGNRRIYKRRKT